MAEALAVKPHDIAAAEISCWRGRCLDLFARGERAVALALEVATSKHTTPTIKHLAGHRLADLARAIGEDPENKLSKPLVAAIEGWTRVEMRRPYFAHGVTTVLLDKLGAWHAQFDFTCYQARRREPQRWVCSRQEASEFESELERAYKLLASLLGQYRKRLAG